MTRLLFGGQVSVGRRLGMKKEIGNEWKNMSVSAQQLNLLTVYVQSVIVSILLRKIIKKKLALKSVKVSCLTSS